MIIYVLFLVFFDTSLRDLFTYVCFVMTCKVTQFTNARLSRLRSDQEVRGTVRRSSYVTSLGLLILLTV